MQRFLEIATLISRSSEYELLNQKIDVQLNEILIFMLETDPNKRKDVFEISTLFNEKFSEILQSKEMNKCEFSMEHVTIEITWQIYQIEK